MKKFNDFFTNHGTKLICVLLVLIYFKTCSTDRTVDKVKKQVTAVDTRIEKMDSTFTAKIIEKPEMIQLIKNTPAWRTLEIEELSDKHRVPINSYKNKEEN